MEVHHYSHILLNTGSFPHNIVSGLPDEQKKVVHLIIRGRAAFILITLLTT